MKRKLIGFDLDGVLIDSLPLMKIAWEDCKIVFDFETKFESYQNHVGKPFEEIMNALDLDMYLPEIKQQYDQICMKNIDKIKPYEGFKELLQGLKKLDNCFLAIITSKTKSRAEKIVSKFGLEHDLLITPEDTSKGKPNPEPLLMVNRFFDIRPSRNSCIYIGDMETDFMASNSANWLFIHAKWGYGEISEKYDDNFFEKCDTITSLNNYLERWFKI